MTSRAEQLFEKITTGKAGFLRKMVDDRTPETHFLEFKGGKIQADLKGVKEAWSEALSGFANTEGGVLIWGIRASKELHPDDPSVRIDSANKLELVELPDSFREALKDRLLEATVAPVTGVEICAIEDSQESGRGFVVCLIPEGNDKPHRAANHPTKNYFQRIDDSFVVIQHPLLRHMFYPRLHPKLSVEIVPEVKRIEDEVEILFKGYIGNSGTATARELWIVISPNLDKLISHDYYKFKAHAGMHLNGKNCKAWEAFQSVHPGAKVPVFFYAKRLIKDEVISPVEFEIALHAQHQLAQDVTLHLSVDDIENGEAVSEDAEIREA